MTPPADHKVKAIRFWLKHRTIGEVSDAHTVTRAQFVRFVARRWPKTTEDEIVELYRAAT